MKFLKNSVQIMLISSFLTLSFSKAYSQDAPAAASGQGSDVLMQESMNDLFLVLGCGAGGAILGLSTLSFYTDPGDHLRNILVGGAIGVIVGVGFVAYSQATKSQELINENYTYQNRVTPEFGYKDRVSWHQDNFTKYAQNNSKTELPQIYFSTSF